jgi:hypothetical protein
MAGVSSLDFGFRDTTTPAANAFPRNSCYDTFEWMNKFGDPGFNYHRALAQIWALLILEVADQALLPFDLRTYATAVQKTYLHSLTAYATHQQLKFGLNTTLDLTPLQSAAEAFTARAASFHAFEDYWTRNIFGPGAGGIENRAFGMQRLQFNDALSNFERDLLDLPRDYHDSGRPYGVPGREQFKHVLFGPQDSRTAGEAESVVFPLVREALQRGDWEGAREMVERTAEVLGRAVGNLPFII